MVFPRQSTFDAEKDMYPSKNVFEDSKAFANFLAVKGWTSSFESFIDMITLFDDHRLEKVTIITCIQEWSVILQKYADSISPDVHLQLLLEGCRLMLPNVAEDSEISKCIVPTAQRDVSCYDEIFCVCVQSCPTDPLNIGNCKVAPLVS